MLSHNSQLLSNACRQSAALSDPVRCAIGSGAAELGGQGAMAPSFQKYPFCPPHFLPQNLPKHAISRSKNPKFRTVLNSPAFGPRSGPLTFKYLPPPLDWLAALCLANQSISQSITIFKMA